MAAGAQAVIDGLLKEHKVVVFSKSWCPFCTKAKESLAAMTGARTVPRIFIEGKCIGGCDDLAVIHKRGELHKLLPIGSASDAAAKAFKVKLDEADMRTKLGDQRYRVLRQGGTERPGSHEYDKLMPQAGHFACGACGLPLYSADSKFRSSCGWPVFDKCYYSKEAGGCHIGTRNEWGAFEIICNRCDSHLGHVFFDAFSAKNPNGERH